VQSFDASLRDVGASDASASDAQVDGDGGASDGAAESGVDAGRTRIQCAAPFSPPPTSGISVSNTFYSGYRFQVTTTVTVRSIGLTATSFSQTAGTLFGAFVRLSGPSDAPDSPSLITPDVFGTTLIALPGNAAGATVATAATSVTLTPGWYALVFGAGAFGSTLTGAVATTFGTSNGCTALPGTGGPFTLRQSDGALIVQTSSPHFFLEY